jgi:TolA-binding protein
MNIAAQLGRQLLGAGLKTPPNTGATEVTRLKYLCFPARFAEEVRASSRPLLLFKQALMRRLAFSLALSIFGAAQVWSADTPESDDAFKAAAKPFQDKIYDRAEKQFEEFIAKYPQSARVPEVVLLQAQCRFERTNFVGAAELLIGRMGAAGEFGDQYRYWIAEARFHDQKYSAASEAYADLLRAHTNSPLRLRASYGEAFSHFKLNNFSRTVELLNDPAAPFQQAAQTSTNDTEVVRGYLLMGEALRAQRNYRAVEEALMSLSRRKLSPDLDWQREYLLANSQLADGRPEDALKKVTNLVALATAATNPVLHANSLMFQAAILESKQPDAAIQTYERITEIKDVSASQSRQAILKIVDLMMAQNRLTNAMERLKTFVGQSPQDAASHLLRLTLGELHLRHSYSLAEKVPKPRLQTNLAAISNSLQQAKTNFDFIINLGTNANRELIGKAHLNRGWCRWEESRFIEGPARLLESQQDFQAAAGHLPVSEDQAIARFKWADCQFELRDYTNAMTNYKFVIENYSDLPQVKTNLFGQALDHMLRSSIEVDDFDGAKDAMEKNLAWFPKSSLGHQGVLTYAVALLNRNKPVMARLALNKFQQGFPDSPLLPEIQLALARTFVEQANWPSAIIEYDRWVIRHTNHNALSQAEFDRAWVYYQQGNETNALHLFTNYVTRFAASPLAPLAKYWVAEYYYRHNDPLTAEVNYKDKIIVQNTNLPLPDLSYQSRLMTGKAAFMRQAYAEARGYLNDLIRDLERMDDTNSPRALLSEAYLMFGDIVLTDPAPGATNVLIRFEEAINIFKRARRLPAATNRLAVLATGKIADCLSQLHRYAEATAEYRNIIPSPLADVTMRSQAEVRLGEILENQAGLTSASAPDRKQLLESALNHYLNVFHGKNLVPGKHEQPEPFWVKRAGLQAASLAEKLQRVSEAIGIYARLLNELPSLRPTWESKIELLKKSELKK